MAESQMSPRRVEAALKQRTALELRMAGRTWQEIAEHLGYANHSGAIAAVRTALSKTLQEPAENFRAMQLERLEKIIQVYWPMMLRGDIAGGNMCLKAIKDLRDMLRLDSPTKIEYSGPDGSPIRHEVITLDAGDITDAIKALEEAGVVRVDSTESGNGTIVDAVHSPSTNGKTNSIPTS